MMKMPKLAATLTLILCCATSMPAAETGDTDAERYLQQYGLEEIHASYTRFFSLLSEGKTVEANQALAQSLPPNVNPQVRDQVLKATAGLSAIFDRGVEDAELVGLQKVSNKSIALYYVLNSNGGPILVILMPFRQRDQWRTHTWMMKSNAPDIIEALKGVGRFQNPAVIPFKTRGGMTA